MPVATRKRRSGANNGREISPFQSVEELLFPKGYRLLMGTSQIYELELAVAESRVLTEAEVVSRGAYFAAINGVETNHVKMCGVTPVQVDASSSARRKSFFAANIFKTGYATHGLFPYRGKYHPQMVKAIINIIGLKPCETLLDPMMGSGTACLEASLVGVNAVGIDASPFCVLMATGKQQGAGARASDVAAVASRADCLFDELDRGNATVSLASVTGGKRKAAGRNKAEASIQKFAQLCYLDAMGYAARRTSKSPRELFPLVLQRYIAAAGNFGAVRDQLDLRLGDTRYSQGDARDLLSAGINDSSIDGIVTSPPYSFAIDYLENDAAQLSYLHVDAGALREKMIGLRGGSLRERIECYLTDMNSVFGECARVLKGGRFAVFVVGTNSNQLKRALGNDADEIRIDEAFVKIAAAHGLRLDRDIIHPIEGIYNTMRDEHILFFRKV